MRAAGLVGKDGKVEKECDKRKSDNFDRFHNHHKCSWKINTVMDLAHQFKIQTNLLTATITNEKSAWLCSLEWATFDGQTRDSLEFSLFPPLDSSGRWLRLLLAQSSRLIVVSELPPHVPQWVSTSFGVHHWKRPFGFKIRVNASNFHCRKQPQDVDVSRWSSREKRVNQKLSCFLKGSRVSHCVTPRIAIVSPWEGRIVIEASASSIVTHFISW